MLLPLPAIAEIAEELSAASRYLASFNSPPLILALPWERGPPDRRPKRSLLLLDLAPDYRAGQLHSDTPMRRYVGQTDDGRRSVRIGLFDLAYLPRSLGAFTFQPRRDSSDSLYTIYPIGNYILKDATLVAMKDFKP